MKPAIYTAIALSLLTSLTATAAPVVVTDGLGSAAWAGAPVVVGVPATTGWEIRDADHICGLKNANQLSYPALIDFDDVMAATDEMKTIKREGIDPASPRGQQLVNRATRRVTDAAKKVMGDAGHCSVWKSISHTDGREITNVTAEVRRNL